MSSKLPHHETQRQTGCYMSNSGKYIM